MITLLITANLYAQQLPLNDLYHQNRLLINPANTGDHVSWSFFLNARNQWVGIDGSPKTNTVGVHGMLNDKMGVGGFVVSDRSGLIDRTALHLNYAYRVKLTEDHLLTLALNGVVNENRFLMENAKVKDLNDKLFSLQSYEGMKLDAGFGMKYNWRKLEFGISIPYLFESQVRYFTTESDDYVFDFYRHYNVFLSYDLALKNKYWSLAPSIMYRTARQSPSQTDLQVITKWHNKYWLGLGYRNSGKTWVESAAGGDYTQINLSLSNSYFLISGGIALMDNIDLAYAYELSNSTIYDRSHGTHEIMISYTFGGRAKNYEAEINALKENQLALNRNLDTIGIKLDENNKAIQGIARDNSQQKQQLTEIKGDISKLRDDLNNLPKQTAGSATIGISYNSVYFNTGGYVLSRETKIELLKFVALAKDVENKVEISGYADDTGENDLNLVLSQKRAESVSDYLVKSGITKERITINYYGEDKPLVPNTSTEGRLLNRRVDVKLIQ